MAEMPRAYPQDIRAAACEALERVRNAERDAGHKPGAVRVVAVGKTRPGEAYTEAFLGGVREFGENYVQEAVKKAPFLPEGCLFHMVGSLQKNKASKAAGLFHMVQALDSVETAAALDRASEGLGKNLDVLVQVNIADEASKSGIKDVELEGFLDSLEAFRRLSVRGIMVIPPPEDSVRYFAPARRLFESAGAGRECFDVLSMGMSSDFERAIAEGSTMVRLGRAVFGRRQE